MKGTDMNKVKIMEDGKSALHHLCEIDILGLDEEIAKYCSGIICEKDFNGKSILHSLIDKKASFEQLEILINANNNVKSVECTTNNVAVPFLYYILLCKKNQEYRFDLKVLKLLMKGTDMEEIKIMEDGKSALHHLCESSIFSLDGEVVGHCLKIIKKRDSKGKTALHYLIDKQIENEKVKEEEFFLLLDILQSLDPFDQKHDLKAPLLYYLENEKKCISRIITEKFVYLSQIGKEEKMEAMELIFNQEKFTFHFVKIFFNLECWDQFSTTNIEKDKKKMFVFHCLRYEKQDKKQIKKLIEEEKFQLEDDVVEYCLTEIVYCKDYVTKLIMSLNNQKEEKIDKKELDD